MTNAVKRIQAVRQAFHGRRYCGDCRNGEQINHTNPRIELSVQERSHPITVWAIEGATEFPERPVLALWEAELCRIG